MKIVWATTQCRVATGGDCPVWNKKMTGAQEYRSPNGCFATSLNEYNNGVVI